MNTIVFLSIITCSALLINSEVNLTDLSQCKVSHLGVEFSGSISVTGAYLRCQKWKPLQPLHKVSPDITDNDFPERSMELANNYCRNPTRRVTGPWCYTMDPSVIDDSCEIPLCSFKGCKLTGPGIEYSGHLEKTVSFRKCKRWRSKISKLKTNEGIVKGKVFEDHFFPDGTNNKAGDMCRNPDGDKGGPWCYVETEADNVYEKDYCDVPFCDDGDCMVFVNTPPDRHTYTHFTNMNGSLRNLSFAVKSWEPDNFLGAEVRLVLSVMSVPCTSKQLEELGIGIEIMISNNGSLTGP